MTEYGINQKRLSERIDQEFCMMGKSLQIVHYHGSARDLKGITIASISHWDRSDGPYISSTVATILADIKIFQIGSPATYTKIMLERAGIYGFAICTAKDDYDPDFGELVAKGRLLKRVRMEKSKQR